MAEQKKDANHTNPKDENLKGLGKALTILDNPDVIMNIVVALGAFCAMLLIGDFFHLRHGKFEVEDTFGFYAIFGFIAFSFIIFATKVLKKLISRPENYYAPDVVDAEKYPPEELDVKEHSDA